MKGIDLTKIESEIDSSPFDVLHKLDNIYISSKVDSQDKLSFLKEKEIRLAIDLKRPEETSIDDADEFQKENIEYLSIPVADFSDVSLSELEIIDKVVKSTEGNILIYCMSGNRVAALLALYLVKVCGHPKSRAVDLAKKIGLTKEALENKLIKSFDSL